MSTADILIVIWAALLFLLVVCGWASNLLGLPGNWFNVAAMAVYALIGPADGRAAIGWWAVAIAGVLAVLGEIIEFAAGALGVSKAGGSRRGAVLAVVGSMVGGIVGMFVGLPIPVVGSVVGLLFLACLGALAGAVLGEKWKGRDWQQSFEVGHAAFWGRLFGTLGKLMTGAVIVAVAAAALLLS